MAPPTRALALRSRQQDDPGRPSFRVHRKIIATSREGVPVVVIQRQLRHANLGVTSAYLRGIDNTEIIRAIHQRPAPVIPAGHALRSNRCK